MTTELPESHEDYTDEYFLRCKNIEEKMGMNPIVKARVFFRKTMQIHGVEEALDIINKYTNIFDHDEGSVKAIDEGDAVRANAPCLEIVAPAQELDIETILLGVLSAESTKDYLERTGADWTFERDILQNTKRTFSKVKDLIGGRTLCDFHARHWRYDRTAEISKKAHEGGADAFSTAVGAPDGNAIGTIPHAFQGKLIGARLAGYDNAVERSIELYDKFIHRDKSRVSLIDFNNKEIQDAIKSALICPDLDAVRIDTCGENYPEGGVPESVGSGRNGHWYGSGVTASAVHRLRQCLDEAGFEDVNIVVSSGFGDINKVRSFVKYEQEVADGRRIFDAVGLGGAFDGHFATMDIIEAKYNTEDEYMEDDEIEQDWVPVSKVGRNVKSNPNLNPVD